MNFSEFVLWVIDQQREGRLTMAQATDAIAQRELFDARRQMIEHEFRLQVAGFVANELHSAPSVSELIRNSMRGFPGRMIYFEPIGFEIFR